jgi:hypothetical protein
MKMLKFHFSTPEPDAVRSAEMSGANFSTMLNRFIKSGISALRIRGRGFPRGAWERDQLRNSFYFSMQKFNDVTPILFTGKI